MSQQIVCDAPDCAQRLGDSYEDETLPSGRRRAEGIATASVPPKDQWYVLLRLDMANQPGQLHFCSAACIERWAADVATCDVAVAEKTYISRYEAVVKGNQALEMRVK